MGIFSLYSLGVVRESTKILYNSAETKRGSVRSYAGLNDPVIT